MQLPITSNAIDAIIVMRQSAHEMSAPQNQQRRLWQSASEPQGSLEEGHCESVMSITTILILQQQSLSQMQQLPQQKRDKHNHEPGGPLNKNLRRIWQIHASDLPQQER
jgi:hypothetical protein